MAHLRTVQLSDRVLSEGTVIGVSLVSMAQLRTAQLKEVQVEVSTVCILIMLRCHTPSNNESQMKLILEEDMYRVYTKEWCVFKSEQEIYFSPHTGTTHTVSSGNCFSCATSSSLLMLSAGPPWKLAPRPRSKHEKQTAGSFIH